MNIKLKDLIGQEGIALWGEFRDPPLINRAKTLRSVLSALEQFKTLQSNGQQAQSLLAHSIGELVSVLVDASPLSASEQKLWSRLCEVLADVEKFC